MMMVRVCGIISRCQVRSPLAYHGYFRRLLLVLGCVVVEGAVWCGWGLDTGWTFCCCLNALAAFAAGVSEAFERRATGHGLFVCSEDNIEVRRAG